MGRCIDLDREGVDRSVSEFFREDFVHQSVAFQQGEFFKGFRDQGEGDLGTTVAFPFDGTHQIRDRVSG